MTRPGDTVLETERLVLRRLTLDDAAFILRLVNEPSWLRFIGDRGVRSLDDAKAYIRNGPLESYGRFGFGLYRTDRKATGTPIGICGLVKRDFLEHVDIGFALFPEFWGRGYAFEAASAVQALAHGTLGLDRLVAITAPDNFASIRVLDKLGLKFDRMVQYSKESGEEVALYSE